MTQAQGDMGAQVAKLMAQEFRRELRRINSQGQSWNSLLIEMGLATLLTLVAVIATEARKLASTSPGDLAKGAGELLGDITGTSFTKTLQEGQFLVGFQVTSPFGDRVHPILGTSKFHAGVDLAMNREPLRMPFLGEVTCSGSATSDGGYGLLATITPYQVGAPTLRAGHLEACSAGKKPAGQIFARTGNSGLSTAPHLHWEQIGSDGQVENPHQG